MAVKKKTKKVATKTSKKAVKKTPAKKPAAKQPAKAKQSEKEPSTTWSPDRGMVAVFVLVILVLIAAILAFTYAKAPPAIPPEAVVLVNGQPIYQQDIDDMRLSTAQIDPFATDQVILNRTILLELLKQRAQELNITADQLQVEVAFAQRSALITQQYSEEEFISLLADINLTYEEYERTERKAITDDIIISELLAQEVQIETTNATDADALTYYEENPSLFNVPEQRKVSHILICYDGALSCTNDRAKQEAEELATNIKAQLDTKPEDFNQIASASSDGPSSVQNGSIGQIIYTDVVPAFADVAFVLRASQISDVTESEFGFHIIRVDDIIPPYVIEFQEVKDRIKEQLATTDAQEAQLAYLDSLFANADIVYSDTTN